MALSQGNQALWSDIRGLYTTLRSIESTHGLSQIPDQATAPNPIAASTIASLNTYASNAWNGDSHLHAKSYTAVASPTVGTLINANIVSTIRTNINNMNGVCHKCSQCGNCNCNCECCGFSEGFH